MEARVIDVIEAASAIFKMPKSEMLGRRRFKSVVRVRQVVHFVSREMGHSFPQIGERMGGYDHTTVIHGHRKMADLIATSKEWADMVHATRVLAKANKQTGLGNVVWSDPPKLPASRVPQPPEPEPASSKPMTIQQANDHRLRNRHKLNKWGEEFQQQYVNRRGVYAHPGTADGEERLLSALRREHPEMEIDLKDAKEYGDARLIVEKIPH